MSADSAPLYHIWANHASQGAVELPALIAQIKQGKVQPTTWIYAETNGRWQPANQVDELKMFFRTSSPLPAGAPNPQAPALRPGALRRIKIFAEMDDAQLQVFVAFTQMLQYRQFAQVVAKGDHGDAMYLVLEGELRARSIIDGKESTFATLGPGDFFGEISLLDHGPRSADVVANKDSTVLKITSEAIQKILKEAPAAAAPFLSALSRSVASRLRQLTKRYEDSIHFSRAAALVSAG